MADPVPIRPDLFDRLRRDGGPPDNGDMLERIIKLEAAVQTLATREDLAAMRSEMHKEFTAQTWKLITWTTTLGAALVAAVYFIARNVH